MLSSKSVLCRTNALHGSKTSSLHHSGEKRATETRAPSSSLSPVPDDDIDHTPPREKKRKCAETRPCPVCAELIPIRLLATHAKLEKRRVEAIIKHIGDAEALAEVDDLKVGKRRSALKARQSLTTTPTAIERAIGHITRRRKARHTRLKELVKEEAAWLARHGRGGVRTGTICPVCSQSVHGDRDVVEAHVDACLVYESQRTQAEEAREPMIRGNENADVDIDTGRDAVGQGTVCTRVITNANLRGTGIHIRSSTMDTEDDIDVDGTDDAVFGDVQFGEQDVLRAASEVDMDVDQVESVHQRSDHDRQVQITTSTESSQFQGTNEDRDRLDEAILTARSRGDNVALIGALEAKLNAMPVPATCRICLSPYVDPTVSTGCWHTCCATCWLRCLGTTKLCPMCQRITGASELRRVYL